MNYRLNKSSLAFVGFGGIYYIYKYKLTSLLNHKEAKCIEYRSNAQKPTLIGAQIFFRHGARTPLSHAAGLADVRIHDTYQPGHKYWQI